MIEVLVNAGIAASLTILVLLASQRYWLSVLGASGAYRLWLLVPVSMLSSALPLWQVEVPASFTVLAGMSQPTITAFVHQDSALFYVAIWAIGSLAMVCAAAVMVYRHHRHMRPVSEALLRKLRRHRAILSVLPGITHSDEKSPCLIGWLHPRLSLPDDFCQRYSVEQQRMMLLHEWVHWQRRDPLWNGLACVLCCLYWFNPLMWLGYRAFRSAQEMACDQAVLRNATTAQRARYGYAMLSAADTNPQSPLLTTYTGAYQQMKQRLTLLPAHQRRDGRPSVAIASVFTMLMLVLGSISLSHAGNDKVYPRFRAEPVYPEQAAAQGLEGHVVVQFDLDSAGRVQNLSVLDSHPAQTFDNAALTAVSQWQYDVDGMARNGVLVQLDFVLSEDGKKAALDNHSDESELILVQ